MLVVFAVILMVVVVRIVLVVMIVWVVVVDDGGGGCDSIGGCSLFSFISNVFKSSVYFKKCCYMAIENNNNDNDNDKKSSNPSYKLYRLHPRRLSSDGFKKGNTVLYLCNFFLKFHDIF